MDFKQLPKDEKSSYYTVGWLVKNITITFLCVLPLLYFIGENVLLMIFSVLSVFAIVFIGDLLRRITMPEAVISEGGAWELLKKKIYWAIGPQFAAVFFVYVVGFICFNIFGSQDAKNQLYPRPQTAGEQIIIHNPEKVEVIKEDSSVTTLPESSLVQNPRVIEY